MQDNLFTLEDMTEDFFNTVILIYHMFPFMGDGGCIFMITDKGQEYLLGTEAYGNDLEKVVPLLAHEYDRDGELKVRYPAEDRGWTVCKEELGGVVLIRNDHYDMLVNDEDPTEKIVRYECCLANAKKGLDSEHKYPRVTYEETWRVIKEEERERAEHEAYIQKVRLTEEDMNWQPVYPNNMIQNGIVGEYLFLFRTNEDGTISGGKWTIAYQEEECGHMTSRMDAPVEAYNLFYKRYDEAAGVLGYKEPNEAGEENYQQSTIQDSVNDYGTFVRSYQTLERAKEAVIYRNEAWGWGNVTKENIVRDKFDEEALELLDPNGCYIVKDTETGETFGRKEWEELYGADLKENWEKSWDKDPKDRNTYFGPFYKDPDGSSFSFYEDLAAFLNKREKQMRRRLNGHYIYAASKVHNNCIAVVSEASGFLFYLKSDQLGFSAPSGRHNHPYDTYLQLGEKEKKSEEECIDYVVSWVFGSRSLGGSFLWPIEQTPDGADKKTYNGGRGGSCFGAGNNLYYIEDRADLTLLEIKHFYDVYDETLGRVRHGFNAEFPTDTEFSRDILSRHCSESSNMMRWLKHFGSFGTYVDFFCFNPFVEYGHSDRIIDITESETGCFEDEPGKAPAILADPVKRVRKIYGKKEDPDTLDKSFVKMERMLKNINILIRERTRMMKDTLAR